MNPVIDAIKTRRSVRRFTEQPIAETDLLTIAEAGTYAPSGMNRQTWQFTIVTNAKKIEELAGVIEKVLERPGYDFYKPVALIIPSNVVDSPWGRDDNACALQNMFLAAHSLGIGSVWINQLRDICDNPIVRPLLRDLGIPDNHVVYGLAALGYSAKPPREVTRPQPVMIIR
ncbi:MAG: nitroreductase [Fibrobacter sp.]|nr:nitroreductase [Fibrobacter sp.]